MVHLLQYFLQKARATVSIKQLHRRRFSPASLAPANSGNGRRSTPSAFAAGRAGIQSSTTDFKIPSSTQVESALQLPLVDLPSPARYRAKRPHIQIEPIVTTPCDTRYTHRYETRHKSHVRALRDRVENGSRQSLPASCAVTGPRSLSRTLAIIGTAAAR